MLISLVAFIITISIVVVFHEWGHYLVARANGVFVEKFSLGFGRTLLSKVDSKGTEWAVSLWPLGGYVKPLDEPKLEDPEYKKGSSISEKSPFQKFLIYAAGPFFSFLLGIIIYTFIFILGVKEPAPLLAKPYINTLAYSAGVEKGDKILSVNGSEILSWNQAMEKLLGPATLGERVEIKLLSSGGVEKTIALTFPPAKGNLENYDIFGVSGLMLKLPKPKIIKIIPDGAAQRSGLLEGDLIEQVNGIEVEDSRQLIEIIKSSANKPLTLQVKRNSSDLTISIVPDSVKSESGESIGRIGAQLGGDFPTVDVSYGPIESVFKAVRKTWDTAYISLKLLGRMLTGDLSITNLSGPISIAQYSGQVVQTGVMNFLQFIALISVSIGLLNLLPVPGLDGGQMLIHAVEGITGKELSEKFMRGIVTVGYALLLGLMFIAFRNDILRLIN